MTKATKKASTCHFHKKTNDNFPDDLSHQIGFSNLGSSSLTSLISQASKDFGKDEERNIHENQTKKIKLVALLCITDSPIKGRFHYKE